MISYRNVAGLSSGAISRDVFTDSAVFFPDFFHKKMEKFAIFGFSPPQSFPPRFHGGSSPMSNITPQSARARIGQRT